MVSGPSRRTRYPPADEFERRSDSDSYGNVVFVPVLVHPTLLLGETQSNLNHIRIGLVDQPEGLFFLC